MDTLVTPKFLTHETAKKAVKYVVSAVLKPSPMGELLKRQSCHIVILVPSMKNDGPDYPDWPSYPIEPFALYDQTIGDKSDWTGKCDDIARCKALQLWHDRNDDRTNVMPHLLFPGDTIYWGGVKRQGIVVTCSGVQPWFDKMIAGMIADICIALAYNTWMTSEDKKLGVDFLT